MYLCQCHRSLRNVTIYRERGNSRIPQRLFEPFVNFQWKLQSSLVRQHCHFEAGYRRHRKLIGLLHGMNDIWG